MAVPVVFVTPLSKLTVKLASVGVADSTPSVVLAIEIDKFARSSSVRFADAAFKVALIVPILGLEMVAVISSKGSTSVSLFTGNVTVVDPCPFAILTVAGKAPKKSAATALPVKAISTVSGAPVVLVNALPVPSVRATSKVTSLIPSSPSVVLVISSTRLPASSSVIFMVAAVVSPVTDGLFVAASKVAITVSVFSTSVSFTTERLIVAVVSPAGMVTVPEFASVKSLPAVAVPVKV